MQIASQNPGLMGSCWEAQSLRLPLISVSQPISGPNRTAAMKPAAAPTVAKPGRRRLLIAVKGAVSTLLLYWILSRSNLNEVFATVGSATIYLLLFAYSLDFVGLTLSVVRWRGLLKAQSVEPSIVFLMKSFMVANFFNNFLPSTIGGDVSRAYDAYRVGRMNSGAMTSVVVDRLLGLLTLFLFALVSLPFAGHMTDRLPLIPFWVGLGGAGVVAVVWAIFFSPSLPILDRLLSTLPAAIGRLAAKVFSAFRAYRGKRTVLAKAFGVSILLQANVVLYYILIGWALGLPVPVHSFFLIIPLALFVMMLPISINGIGLRESVLALFLGVYGVGSSEAVAYAWLVYLGKLIQGSLGGVVYALRR